MQRYRITEQGYPYFVTLSIVKWLPVFVSPAPCQIVIDSLSFCREHKGLRIHAYVIMPTHIHLIVSAVDDLSAVLRDFKKHTSKRLVEYFTEIKNPPFINVFRFCGKDNRPPTEHKVWQDGNHPEKIETQAFFGVKLKYMNANPLRKGLVTDAVAWTWSSLRLHEGCGDGPLAVDGIEW
jgi:putative transposase